MLFPTKVKARISSKLSYPVGAELISSELASVPQAPSFAVEFLSKYERMEARGQPYWMFIVEFSERDLWPGWNIRVYPVPRALKHSVRQALISDYFPRIREWLEKHTDLQDRFGYHCIRVLFDASREPPLKLEEHHTPSSDW